MGKFVGLIGALTTFGAVAYLMAPMPPAETVTGSKTAPAAQSSPPPASTAATGAPARVRVAGTSHPGRDPAGTLVHQIQAELQRVGCYTGAIDGNWSEATQRAMQELGERVSVLRPVDTPDYIMLALARDQVRAVCTPGTQRAAVSRSAASFKPTAAPSESRRVVRSGRATSVEPTAVPRATPRRAVRVPAGEASARRAVALSPAEAARAAAAREELARIDNRAPVLTRPAVAPKPVPPATEEVQVVPSPATLERGRMGLGVTHVDPLRAGIDPRDPAAPAILRGPPQPAPVATARATNATPTTIDVPPSSSRRAAPRVVAGPPAQTAKQKRRAWQRTIFNDMQRNGP